MTRAIYVKAFAAALRDHLLGHKYEWTHMEYGRDGCETCGYGADEYDVVDEDRLQRAIDEFAASFKEGP